VIVVIATRGPWDSKVNSVIGRAATRVSLGVERGPGGASRS